MSIARSAVLWAVSHLLNPITIRLAHSGRGPFSLLVHTGRNSGATYQTPLILARAGSNFIAELTYGENVNWYRNIVASGSCTVIQRGRRYRVIAVEPYPSAAGRAAFGAPARAVLTVLGKDQFRLLRVDPTAPGGAGV